MDIPCLGEEGSESYKHETFLDTKQCQRTALATLCTINETAMDQESHYGEHKRRHRLDCSQCPNQSSSYLNLDNPVNWITLG